MDAGSAVADVSAGEQTSGEMRREKEGACLLLRNPEGQAPRTDAGEFTPTKVSPPDHLLALQLLPFLV